MKGKQAYRASVIGLGKIGLMYEFESARERPASHAGAILSSDRFELVGVSDLNPDRSNDIMKIAPNVSFYQNFRHLSQQDFDIISICTHLENRVELLEYIINLQPKLIFCEKPIVSRLSEVERLRKLLYRHPGIHFIPNLSRRWNSGILNVLHFLRQGDFGKLQSMNARYTRGIYNSGSHLFDLLKSFGGPMLTVQTVRKVYTSSEEMEEPSFSFLFSTKETSGYVEAFDDTKYYMFEIDLYFERGKIEIYQSGDLIRYYQADKHPLFDGFKSLKLKLEQKDQLKDSTLKNAYAHIADVLMGSTEPAVGFEDGVYPIYIAEALTNSYLSNGSVEKVVNT